MMHIGFHRSGLACVIEPGNDSSLFEGFPYSVVERVICEIAFLQKIDLASAAFDQQVLTFHGAEEVEDLKNGFLLRFILSCLFGHAEIASWCGDQIIGIRVITCAKWNHTDFMKVFRSLSVFPLVEALCGLTFNGHQ